MYIFVDMYVNNLYKSWVDRFREKLLTGLRQTRLKVLDIVGICVIC